MFEDRTFDNIMSEMLNSFSNNVRTDEGSLTYNACSKIAQKLEEVYGDMEDLNDNLLPSEMDEEHLVRFGDERGIVYSYAKPCTLEVTFLQEIDIDSQFSLGDYIFAVTDVVDDVNHIYKLECTDDGLINTDSIIGQDLMAIDYIDNYETITITSSDITSAGSNDDDIDVYRKKVIDSFKLISVTGNRDYYVTTINNLDGVGAVKPVRRNQSSDVIDIYILNDSYNVPSQTLVNQIQELVDPIEHTGEGYGLAPFCHNVSINAADTVNISVSIDVTLDSGHTWNDVANPIFNAINDYFYELRESWEANNRNPLIVRIAQIESIIINSNIVIDISTVKLNNSSSNVTVAFNKIPILTEVTRIV